MKCFRIRYVLFAVFAMCVSGCGGGGGSSSVGPSPVKTTIATGTASFLVAPKALVLSPKDNMLYVADGGYTGCSPSCILQVDPATGLANPTPVVTGIGAIEGVTFDSTGDNLYYSDRQNRVYRLTYSGSAYVSPTACNDSTVQVPRDPYHLVFDSTLGIISADGNSLQLARISTCAAATAGTAFTATASFSQPRGVAMDSLRNFYVSDNLSDKIFKVDPTTAGVSPYVTAGLNGPLGIQWLGGTSSYANSLVVANSGASAVVAANSSSTRTLASFPTPALDVSIDSGNTSIYVLTAPTVSDVGRIYKITGF